jgi:uncharacterized protein YkwD
MKAKRVLGAILTAAMVFGASVQASAAEPTESKAETAVISQTELTLLTDEELQTLTETAPDLSETRSTATMANRRITEAELAAWTEEYWELGGANAFELEVVRLINIERENIGLNRLAVNPALMMAARFHSTEMSDLVFFSHRSPHHGRGIYRAEMFGHENIREYVWGVRENIASSAHCPYHVVQVWMNSPGHRAAILEEIHLTIGVGAIHGGGTTAKFGS